MGTLEVIRVVLDTNMLVSGLLFGGGPGKLLDFWKNGVIRVIMSRLMLDEFLRVLAYPKFQLSEEEIHYLLYVEVLPHLEMVEVHPGPILIPKDPSDDMFFALCGCRRRKIHNQRRPPPASTQIPQAN